MKRQILFVQGGGAGADDEWDDGLVESLRRELGPGYEIRYPRMPNEGDPSYAAWKTQLERELAALRDGVIDVIGVGHSIGGSILINALADVRHRRLTPNSTRTRYHMRGSITYWGATISSTTI